LAVRQLLSFVESVLKHDSSGELSKKTMHEFQSFGLQEDLLKGIAELGFSTPTPVQALVIPTALTSQSDIVALAQTGTGKTAAFGLPLLQLIDPTERAVQALVLCPTRELCVQVASDLANYSKFAQQYKIVPVYGGASIDRQITQLKSAHIVVATPGRLIDLLERRALRLDSLRRLVLDEADEMLNMGFKDDLDTILASATNKKSVWLFSATMSHEVRSIANNYMTSPIELQAGKRNQVNENIEHRYYVCRSDDRYLTLKRIVDAQPGIFGLIFCRTKAETKEIADQMTRDGYNSDALHGDLSQSDRDRVMNRFREGALQLLIATDVAARGIDVDGISHVIHYGFPDDIEVYTHRSGRTGRAGKTGVSVAIVSSKFEHRAREIERMAKITMARHDIPSGEVVCEQQLLHIIHNIHKTEVQTAEIQPFMPQILAELEDLTKEELIARFCSVEFNRFLSYYKNAPDLNMGSRRRTSIDGGAGGNNSGLQRIFVNIGELDGVDKKTFMRFLTHDAGVPAQAIGSVDIKKAYMHFDIAAEYFPATKTALLQLQFNGRTIRVDDATPRMEREGGREERRSPFNGGGSRYSDRGFDRKSTEKRYDKKSSDRSYDKPYKKRY
jgi:ATP-dependent RNA helicase DeaD